MGRRLIPRIVVFCVKWLPMPERLLVWLAERLAESRPLDLYPGWRFGIGEERRDLIMQVRLALWNRCKRARISRPVRFLWVEGLELRLNLGNDTSRCLYVDGAIEPNGLAMIGRVLKPSMTFIDIGANEGLFSLLAARRVGKDGKVIAIEPSRRELEWLRRNVEVNHLRNIHVVATAVADVRGTATLHVANEEHAGHNTLGEFVWDGVYLSHNEDVPVTTIDDIAARADGRRVDVMKIDIEGAELRALRGAAATVCDSRPLILLELSERSLLKQGASSAEMLRWLADNGYDIFTFDDDSGLPRLAQAGEALSSNIVAMHRQRVFGELANA